METRKLKDIYKDIAHTLDAYKRCIETDNKEWEEKHEQRIKELIDELPHGSGLDGTWKIDLEKSNDSKLILYMQYHCMNQDGYYDGWVDFTLKVTPSLAFGINLQITGNFGRYHNVKEYLYEILQ